MTKIIPTVKIDPNDVKKALKLWHKNSFAGEPLSHLLVYQQKLYEMDGNIRAATNEVLYDGINAMRMSKYKIMIQQRYIDALLVRHIANQLNTSESSVYTIQKEAIELLTEELEAFENEIILSRVDLLDERLPFPTYQNLIGVEDHIEMLRPLLNASEPPWIISLVGMGGIGKTSLADSLLRHSFPLGPFEQAAWVSAKPNYYHLSGEIKAIKSPEKPAITVNELVDELLLQLRNVAIGSLDPESAFHILEDTLKEDAHLVVIDNLETISDLHNLLPTLRRLSNPTRFVLTSRENLHDEADVYNFSVPELTFESTVDLIRQEAKLRNMIHLKPATKEELLPIYETVGGNPLAIYLIVGLTHVHPLHVILDDLRGAYSKKVKNLYHYIYRQSWDNLDEATREVFIQLSAIRPGGAEMDDLLYLSDLSADELTDVLDLLGHLNLIQTMGELDKRVYSLHNLTRAFLLEQVVIWNKRP